MKAPSKPVVHGTRYAYQKIRCRCDECVTWNRERLRAYRAQLPKAMTLPEKIVEVEHLLWSDTPVNIAARLGYKDRGTMLDTLRNAGRQDLVDKLVRSEEPAESRYLYYGTLEGDSGVRSAIHVKEH